MNLAELQALDLISKLPDDVPLTAKDDPGAAVTARYTKPEWELLRKWAEKVQEYVFRSAPNLHNDLLPEGVEPLDAPPPHVPSPPKKRPGRPRKALHKKKVSGCSDMPIKF